MVRGKLQLEKIQKPANRAVTFSKRKGGLLKKAFELSTLCGVEVGLIMFSPSGKLHEFASSSMNRILENYQTSCSSQPSQNIQVENMRKELKKLESNCKNMIGEDLDSLSLKELHVLEKKIYSSVRNIHLKKEKMSLEYIASLKSKARSLKIENANLCKKISGSHKAQDNAELEADYATQHHLPQINLSLTLSRTESTTCGTSDFIQLS